MNKKIATAVLIPLALLAACFAQWHKTNAPPTLDNAVPISHPPQITPDYANIVIPPNIAPMNFVVQESGPNWYVKIHSTRGSAIEVSSSNGTIDIPPGSWRSLLQANRGEKLIFDIYAGKRSGRWRRFPPIVNTIADTEINGYLVYRLIRPLYNTMRKISICQRDLSSFEEIALFENRSAARACINCHTFNQNNPDQMLIHFRSTVYGKGMLLAENGKVRKVGLLGGYSAWHPTQRLAAFSVNKVRQFFHRAGPEVRDVCDLDSYIAVYSAETDTVVSAPPLADKNRMETYPAWSPDGRHLYYCSAPIPWADRNTVPPKGVETVQYDLMRASYDPAAKTWGHAETILSAAETGKSITQPKVSPDGRFVLVSASNYGCFPIYQPSCDLYLVDLKTGKHHRLACNSDQSDTWHCWSSDGRWVVFSSKRRDGQLARPHFTCIDAEGKSSKAFILPQKDPTLYDRLVRTYNLPELITGPVPLTTEDFGRAARMEITEKVAMPVTGATPKAKVDNDLANEGYQPQ